jgi:hypothetical protein
MDRKKQAAAMAAVYSYMAEREDDQVRQVAETRGFCSEMQTGSPANIWGLAGRQFMMQANTMMQMRMLK